MNSMIAQLITAYGTPKKDADDAQAFLQLYARLLEPYVESELLAAADRLLRTRKYKSWPSTGECVQACEDARQQIRERLAVEQGRQRQIARQQKCKPFDQLSPEEQQEARDFVDGVADGSIELFQQPQAGNVLDTGLLAKQLRIMAQNMRARRNGG
jgi:hypothetical protein